MPPCSTIQQLALYLGHPWKYNHLEQSSWRYEIIDGSGRGLLFRTANNNRFEISGMFSHRRTKPHHNDYKTIGVSRDRHPKDLAADISRRLLPHYFEAYKLALKRYEDEQQHEENLDYICHLLKKASKGHFSSSSRGERRIYFDHGEMQLWAIDKTITLKLNRLSPEKVLQILHVLRQ